MSNLPRDPRSLTLRDRKGASASLRSRTLSSSDLDMASCRGRAVGREAFVR
jgi:hypothetical protein